MSQSPTAATEGRGFAYRPDIDGLRAVAVLLVLVFHFRLIPAGKAGFLGVDMFFVISGFLIMTIVRRQLDEGTFKLGAFYLARIRRLAPVLVVVLLFTLLYGWLRLLPLEFAEMGRQVASAQFYVSNVYYWRNFNYFGLGHDNVYLLHTWSLAVEEQFYLLFPLAVMGLHRWARKWFWPAVAMVALASFALNVVWVIPKAMNTFYMLPTRAWEMLAGALLAGVAWRSTSRWVNDGLGVLALLTTLAAVFFFNDGIPVPGWFALLPVVAAVLFLMAGGDPRTTTSRVLGAAPMVYVGSISYALYLVHWPIHVFAGRELGEGYDLRWRLGMFALSFVAADLVSRFVERPIRHRQWLASPRKLQIGYGAALLLTAALCGTLAWTGGVPQRVPAEAARLEAFVNDRTPLLNACQFRQGWTLPPAVECRIGDPAAEPTWVVFGDSHAWAGSAAYSRWLSQKGEAGWLVFKHGCPPLLGVHMVSDHTDECHNFNRDVYDWLARSPGLSGVLMVSTWLQASEGGLATSAGQDIDRTRSLTVFDRQLGASLERLKEARKQVWLWGPVPGAKAAVPHALALAAWRGSVADLAFTRVQHQQQFAFFYDTVARHRAQIDQVVVPGDVLCASGHCRVSTDDGSPLYFDNAHAAASPSEAWRQVIDGSGKPALTP